VTVNTHNDEDKYYDKLPFKVDFEKKNLEISGWKFLLLMRTSIYE